MHISYEDIFKNTEIYNPVSLETLFLAGKIAQMDADKSIIDLASGSGYPSLMWTSIFGVQVEGYEINEKYVTYANARAKLLNLEGKAQYFCQDLKNLTKKKYDAVSALGFDVNIYGNRTQTLNRFKSMLNPNGVIIFTEPNWIAKPVPPNVPKTLGVPKDDYLTIPKMQQLLEYQGFKELWHATSTKEDWEIYVQPIFITMQQYIKNHPERKQDAQAIINHFQAEYDFAGKYWNVTLWILKPT